MAREEQTTILVKGNTWTVYLATPERYVELNGTDSAAVTWPNHKKIYFRTDEVNVEVVRHELFHAYFAESHVESADLTALQAEEVSCSIFGEYGDQITKQARELKRWLSATSKKVVEHNRKNRKNDKKTKRNNRQNYKKK